MRKSFFLSASWYAQVVISSNYMDFELNTKYSVKIAICYDIIHGLD